MALSVDYLYQFTLKLIRKNQAGGLSAGEFGYFWNDSQSSYQDDLLGRFQRNSNGKSGLNTGLIQNDTILTKLTPFIKAINVAPASGNVQKPTDFVYTLALRANGSPIFRVTHDKIWSLNSDVIDPPSISEDSYYYTEYLNYYTILPTAVTSVDLDYISSPTNVSWAFTLDGDQRQVYDPNNSVEPQWDNNSCMEITKRMLKVIGVSFHDKDFEQFGQSVLNTGE